MSWWAVKRHLSHQEVVDVVIAPAKNLPGVILEDGCAGKSFYVSCELCRWYIVGKSMSFTGEK